MSEQNTNENKTTCLLSRDELCHLVSGGTLIISGITNGKVRVRLKPDLVQAFNDFFEKYNA
ncbi:hypothetical protein ACI3E1_07395 [Ligilactobacillus sp. LYQ139]|uniref:hypothetical protein n=1 Tax=Ligilactobacillus sp. LYQ139 TaxID=3378800 RepID=UPI003853A7D9